MVVLVRKRLHVCALFHFFLHLLKQVGGEDEIVELLVRGSHDLVFVTRPGGFTLVDKDDVLANTHHRIHVVGIDDGGGLELLRNAVQQFIDNQGGLGIQS